MGRNERGEYVNDKGVTIKINTDKNDKTHISFYDSDPSKPEHSAVHININSDMKSYNVKSHNGDKSEKDSHSGECYLTTACLKYLNDEFDDNCYELTTLRWFRDKYVSKQDIKHYYEIAPIIVEGINNSQSSDNIYNYIYINIVSYCVKKIEKKEYKSAYQRYKNSILILENEFALPILRKKLVNLLNEKITKENKKVLTKIIDKECYNFY